MAVPPTVDLEMPLSVFGLSPRERSLLDRVPIRTLGDLLRRTDSELLAMPEFTPNELAAIETELSRHGLRLGMLASGPSIAISTDDALVVLEWFRQVQPQWRDHDDLRLAGRIATWLGASMDEDHPEPDDATDDIDDTVSFDADEIDLHDVDSEAAIDVDASDDDISETDIELELNLALADAVREAVEAGDTGEIDHDLDDEDDDHEPDDEPGDDDGTGGQEPEAGDVLPPEESWRSSNDWKPDDPDAWKGPDVEDDSEGWKRDDSDNGSDVN